MRTGNFYIGDFVSDYAYRKAYEMWANKLSSESKNNDFEKIKEKNLEFFNNYIFDLQKLLVDKNISSFPGLSKKETDIIRSRYLAIIDYVDSKKEGKKKKRKQLSDICNEHNIGIDELRNIEKKLKTIISKDFMLKTCEYLYSGKTPIITLNLSTRAYNSLMSIRIYTIEDLINESTLHAKLLKSRSGGPGTENEIYDKVHALGYKFANEEVIPDVREKKIQELAKLRNQIIKIQQKADILQTEITMLQDEQPKK